MSLLTITLENKTKKLLQRIGTTTIFLPDPSMQLNEAQQQVTLQHTVFYCCPEHIKGILDINQRQTKTTAHWECTITHVMYDPCHLKKRNVDFHRIDFGAVLLFLKGGQPSKLTYPIMRLILILILNIQYVWII